MTSRFRISPMQDSSILYIYSIRNGIQTDPSYQRMSDIWTLDKQQLLIDSIINGFDIPKLYFHEFLPLKSINSKSYQYAIIDGKQRLQAIWKFIDNKFALPKDFEYIEDETIDLSGMTYSDIANKFPLIKIRFDSKTLPIITVQTNDVEFIEDMFSRLNEAVPLSAPEKRNAFGGPLPRLIRQLARGPFFKENLPFTNSRYRHFDLATKFLYFEKQNKFSDTKKRHLDDFVRSFVQKELDTGGELTYSEKEAKMLFNSAKKTISQLTKTFSSKDTLLSSMGTVVVYYFIWKFNSQEKWFAKLSRNTFLRFEKLREANRKAAEENGSADLKLLEYDRLVTSPNDSSSIEFRYNLLLEFLRREAG